MSSRVVLSGITGLSIGAGLASYFFNRNSAVTTTQTTPVPIFGNQGGKSDGTIRIVGSNIDPAGLFKYGFPGPIHDLKTREQYVSCYNRQTRNPYWVVEHITAESLLNRNSDRKNSVFMEDEDIPEMFRAKLKDYFRSGYDRGHQVPAADAKYSQQVMNDTFYLTNMCPQLGEGFNRDYWAHFEYFCRGLVSKYKSVRIVTGPLYLPKKDPVDGKFRVSYEVIGNPPNVAVPTHFFKLIVAENSNQDPKNENIAIAAFVMPNEPIPNETKLTDFEVPVNALERSTGLELLRRIPEAQKKELCKEVNCQIIVREFAKKALPPPKK